MAKLNWQKLSADSKQQAARDNYLKQQPVGGSSKSFYKNSKLWHIAGKHYGTHIHKLPLHYLNWVVDNLSGDAKQTATDELYRRFAELTHKVGGPV